MINFIVVIVSVFAIGFLVLWILQPSFRTWVERPKYMVLENDQRLNETKQNRLDLPRGQEGAKTGIE
jgi:hypothetical protein